MSRRLPVLLALGALLLLATACGVPVSKAAQTLPRSELPAALDVGGTSTSTSSSTTTTSPPKASHQLTVYLVDAHDDRLVAATRSWSQRLTPGEALAILALGPNADEKDLTSGIALSASLPVEVSKAGIAEVTLDSTFEDLFGSSLYLPLAQIVYTLMTNFPSIKGVDFYLENGLFNYTPTGAASSEPVTKKTYQMVGPLPVKKPSKKTVPHAN